MRIDSHYIFGASTNGEQCLNLARKRGFKIIAFLDNFTEKIEFCGLPVLRPANADKDIPVVITSPNYYLDIMLQLDWMGFRTKNQSQFNAEMGYEQNWMSDFEQHYDQYAWIRHQLADARSVSVFDAVIKFRKTLDSCCLAAVRSKKEDQWFDPEFFKPGPHVYVDGGAYNGDTAEEFIRQCPGYKTTYLFEPCGVLAYEAQKRLNGHSNVCVFKMGLSNGLIQTHLKNAGFPSGTVGIDGEKIVLERLDDVLMTTPTFIKLDVEGCEKDALLGAKRHIKKGKPFIACAVYHKPEDIWEIPKILSEMQDYKFYLRHYTQFYHETVLYCI